MCECLCVCVLECVRACVCMCHKNIVCVLLIFDINTDK